MNIDENKRKAHLAINKAFCGHPRAFCYRGNQGFIVAGCETGQTWDIRAGVGKHNYWGLFQMGYTERHTYGFAFSPWSQATAARKYFNISGWKPWDCAYRMGIL